MTPLFSKLLQLSQQDQAPFYAPGHKRGNGIFGRLQRAWGKAVFQADLPELPGLDNLFAPAGVIDVSQKLAAQMFGAEQTWFLANGSTCGILAAILATVSDGDKILLPRNIHQSAISGLILSGAMPIFIQPPYDAHWDLHYGLTPASVEAALAQHPDLKAVLVLSPTYQGICPDLKAIADITHRQDLPLIVDEAHGSHFCFHPDLPPSALSLGADLVIQSTHKTLGAMTQSAMLHHQGSRVDPTKISRALQLVESTSPSYLLLASLDAAREQMATDGEMLWSKTLHLTADAKDALIRLPGIEVFNPSPHTGIAWMDPTRLTLCFSQLGLSGFAADELLIDEFGVVAELPLWRSLTCMITYANTQSDLNQLVEACRAISQGGYPQSEPISITQPSSLSTKEISVFELPTLSPRQAFFAESETVLQAQSYQRFSAELICPYPPGIPVLMPGECITPDKLVILNNALSSGGIISGASDPSLATLKVIA